MTIYGLEELGEKTKGPWFLCVAPRPQEGYIRVFVRRVRQVRYETCLVFEGDSGEGYADLTALLAEITLLPLEFGLPIRGNVYFAEDIGCRSEFVYIPLLNAVVFPRVAARLARIRQGSPITRKWSNCDSAGATMRERRRSRRRRRRSDRARGKMSIDPFAMQSSSV